MISIQLIPLSLNLFYDVCTCTYDIRTGVCMYRVRLQNHQLLLNIVTTLSGMEMELAIYITI